MIRNNSYKGHSMDICLKPTWDMDPLCHMYKKGMGIRPLLKIDMWHRDLHERPYCW